MLTPTNCKKVTIKLRQGDATNFNGNCIIFRIKTDIDLTGWKAVFQLQNVKKEYLDISSKEIELILSSEDTASLEIGVHNGWLQLIDAHNNPGTIYTQEFIIQPRKVM